jgi:hypothetical protein
MLSPKPSFHGRAKHIKVRPHFLRDHVEKGDIEMKYIDTVRQMTDIFTKHLDATRFASLLGAVATRCLPSLWHGLRGACILPCIYSVLSSLHCISFIST